MCSHVPSIHHALSWKDSREKLQLVICKGLDTYSTALLVLEKMVLNVNNDISQTIVNKNTLWPKINEKKAKDTILRLQIMLSSYMYLCIIVSIIVLSFYIFIIKGQRRQNGGRGGFRAHIETKRKTVCFCIPSQQHIYKPLHFTEKTFHTT